MLSGIFSWFEHHWALTFTSSSISGGSMKEVVMARKKGKRRRGIGQAYRLTFTLSDFLQAYYVFFPPLFASCRTAIAVPLDFKGFPPSITRGMQLQDAPNPAKKFLINSKEKTKQKMHKLINHRSHHRAPWTDRSSP